MPVTDYAELLGRLAPLHPPRRIGVASLRRAARARLRPDKTYFEVPKHGPRRATTTSTTGIAGVAPAPRHLVLAAQCQTLVDADSIQKTTVWRFIQHGASRSRIRHQTVTSTNGTRSSVVSTSSMIKKTGRCWRQRRARPSVDHSTGLSAGGLITGAASPIPNGFPDDLIQRTSDGPPHDLNSDMGAANIDSACTGTALGEFRRASDLADLSPPRSRSSQTVPNTSAQRYSGAESDAGSLRLQQPPFRNRLHLSANAQPAHRRASRDATAA